MTVIESETQFRREAAKEKPLCVFFTAEACPDCRVIDAVMPGLESQFEREFTFAKIDRDQFTGITEEFDVVGIPSLVVFREGRMVGRFINRLRKTRAQFVDFLENLSSTADA